MENDQYRVLPVIEVVPENDNYHLMRGALGEHKGKTISIK
jgi:hypothetical protein